MVGFEAERDAVARGGIFSAVVADALRRGHMWGSVFFTPQEDLLVVTRP